MGWISEQFNMYRDLGLDGYLGHWAGLVGVVWMYLLLFAVIFCETGLVVTPFLPGDSLLFAIGALIASGKTEMTLPIALLLLIVAAVGGDALNYSIGLALGPRVFRWENSWLLNKKHLLRTQEFYLEHGGKTIFLARFIPIIRTFAPFVAGIGRMPYRRFSVFNVTGGITWVSICLIAGYFFGNMTWVKAHFEAVVVVIILISVLPLVIEWILSRRRAARLRDQQPLLTALAESSGPARPDGQPEKPR